MFKSRSNFGFGARMPMDTIQCPPVMEPPCENIVKRDINYEVKHIQPIHTKVINHHIYHHSYVPCFTCSEENICSNVFDVNPCCK